MDRPPHRRHRECRRSSNPPLNVPPLSPPSRYPHRAVVATIAQPLSVQTWRPECATLSARFSSAHSMTEEKLPTFADFDLIPQVLAAVRDVGYETPTPI